MDSLTRTAKPQPIKAFSLGVSIILIALFSTSSLCFSENREKKNAQIEYISPDGQFSSLTPQSVAVQPSAAFVDSDTISCVLKEGETTFIIELPKNTPHDRFTFLNENVGACGELRIAVSNSALPVDSPKWTEVDGIVPFAHKRLFKLSILGVDTKFVRLSFKVDSSHYESAKLSDPFRSSVLTADINSRLTKLGERGHDFSIGAVSVAPLPANQKKR